MTHRATTRLLVQLVTAGAVIVAAPGIAARSATGAGATASGPISAAATPATSVVDDRVPTVPSAPIPAPPAGIYMVTDSVGLGAKDALPAAFPGQRVVVDGTPALFVEMLESRLVQPRIAAVGQQENHFRLQTQGIEQGRAVLGLAIGGNIGDELNELPLVVTGGGDQLAAGQVRR